MFESLKKEALERILRETVQDLLYDIVPMSRNDNRLIPTAILRVAEDFDIAADAITNLFSDKELNRIAKTA